MPQTVPSAGFTPPPSCYDYSNFAADNFDLSLLPDGGGNTDFLPLSPSTQFYGTHSPPPSSPQPSLLLPPPKIFTTFYPNLPATPSDFQTPDFQTLLIQTDDDIIDTLQQEKYYQQQQHNNANKYLDAPLLSPYAASAASSLSPHYLMSPNCTNSSEQFNSYRQSESASDYDTLSIYSSQSPTNSCYSNYSSSYYSGSGDESLLAPPPSNFDTYKSLQTPPPQYTESLQTSHSFYNYKSLQTPQNNSNQQQQQTYRMKKEDNNNYPLLSESDDDKELLFSTTYNGNNTTSDDVLLELLLERTVLINNNNKQIKTEAVADEIEKSTVDFSSILSPKIENDTKPDHQDHQLLRQVLCDTSFQRKFNIKQFDIFGSFITNSNNTEVDIKMEEPDDENARLPEQQGEDAATVAAATTSISGSSNSELMVVAGDHINPVLNLAIEQMRKDVDNTCAALGISPDPTQWNRDNVYAWLQWTSRQFGLNEPVAVEQWSDITGANLARFSEVDFTRRAPQGGMILHAQLEIWKAAYSEDHLLNNMQWLPTEQQPTSSNASSGGDISDDDDDTPSTSTAPAPHVAAVDAVKPTTSQQRSGGSHIHLWQFLKELLASPQTHAACIRWLDRTKGIFKIEDSVKVARLWGKRKNRPAMNYDKLSRSIRQYYKKGIMKKTERSQRLVYQFCHPYNL